MDGAESRPSRFVPLPSLPLEPSSLRRRPISSPSHDSDAGASAVPPTWREYARRLRSLSLIPNTGPRSPARDSKGTKVTTTPADLVCIQQAHADADAHVAGPGLPYCARAALVPVHHLFVPSHSTVAYSAARPAPSPAHQPAIAALAYPSKCPPSPRQSLRTPSDISRNVPYQTDNLRSGGRRAHRSCPTYRSSTGPGNWRTWRPGLYSL